MQANIGGVEWLERRAHACKLASLTPMRCCRREATIALRGFPALNDDHMNDDQRPHESTMQHDVTRLLIDLQQGAEGAADQLMRMVYRELHLLAEHFLRRERADHTLQPTALVHEAYLRLTGQRETSWQNRSQFFGIAAQAMRRILVDHARRVHAIKRDGGERVTLDESVAESPQRSVDLIALDDALNKLAALDPRQARVVELRYFSGLGIEETAAVLSISPATVKRDWTFARAFLQRELERA